MFPNLMFIRFSPGAAIILEGISMPYISFTLPANSTATNPVPLARLKALRSLRVGELVDDLTAQPVIEQIRNGNFMFIAIMKRLG